MTMLAQTHLAFEVCFCAPIEKERPSWDQSEPATSMRPPTILAEGFPPESIGCRKLNKELLCDFYYSDPDLEEFQINFLSGRAYVNLLSFRRSYGELASQAGRVKREYRKKATEAVSTTPAPSGAASPAPASTAGGI